MGEFIMKINKLILLIAILSFLATLAIYPTLPEVIPRQWSFSGEVSTTGNKASIFIPALLPLAILLYMSIIPKIDPKRESHNKHKKAYVITRYMTVLVLVIIHWIIVGKTLGYNISIQKTIPVLIGTLFIGLGNYMGQLRHNYFIGIRTPWTLADEGVWRKTNRFGGYTFILLGMLSYLTVFLNKSYSFRIFLACIFISVFTTYIYSYYQYNKIKSK